LRRCEADAGPARASVREKRGVRGNWARRIADALFVMAVLNFVAFLAVGLAIGGYATHGGFDGRNYFLARTARGAQTVVSERTYRYAQWHQWSLLITHPLAIAAGWVAYRRRRG
jgi:hypothetical protein